MQHITINKQQQIINKIKAKEPFQFNQDGSEFIAGNCKRLHRSTNPSQQYKDIYSDIGKYSIKENAVLVGIINPIGIYEVLVYLSE